VDTTEITGLRVYILGAGPSFCGDNGYPLAKGFLPELKAYADKIASDSDCVRIFKILQYTIRLMEQCQSGQCQAATIDQMISLVLRGQCDLLLQSVYQQPSGQIVSLRYRAVKEAKIATAACFLAKEEQAMTHLLPKYTAFVQDVFKDTQPSNYCINRLSQTRSRVLSFNYDRLFELAFFGAAMADRSLTNYAPYGTEVLNSGFNFGGWGKPEIKSKRFSFVKLHGSIGALCREDEFGQNTYPLGAEINRWTPIKVSDGAFFSNGNSAAAEPLIAFPYEKDFIITKDNKAPFRDYIKAVWNQASAALSEATDIFIIGYSFSDPSDSKHIIDRIKSAKMCRRIVIQNLPEACEKIAELLSVHHEIQPPVVKCSPM
jgi:hypothetical protein